jgi:opacity protein-like surface antigen
LQSQFQSPYANLTVDIAPNWSWKVDYNYYSYGEGTPIGPTLPRSFRGNVYTLGVHYAF